MMEITLVRTGPFKGERKGVMAILWLIRGLVYFWNTEK